MAVRLLIIIFLINPCFSLPVLFDLTHKLKPSAPYFPSQTRFNFTDRTAVWIDDTPPFFYASNSFVTSEHMGTHLDAPYHFSNTSWKVDEIPLERLISVHARIIDVSKQCQTNKTYLITIDDIKQSKLIIPEENEDGSKGYPLVLLFYTGWSKFWPDQENYGGKDGNLEFPGLSAELATHLVDVYKENLVGVGIDTLSVDHGPSKQYLVHQILLRNNIYALENVGSLHILLPHVKNGFFTLDIMPMKIGGGTGAPCRIVARVSDARVKGFNWFYLLVFIFLLFIIVFCGKAVYDLKYNPNKDL